MELADNEFEEEEKSDKILNALATFTKILPEVQEFNRIPFAKKTVFGEVVFFDSTTRQITEMIKLKEKEKIYNNDKLINILKLLRMGDEAHDGRVNTKACKNLFGKTTKIIENGRLEIRLAFKQYKKEIGTSCQMAKKRFYNMESRLSKDKILHERAVVH
jgi:hypothetical protein